MSKGFPPLQRYEGLVKALPKRCRLEEGPNARQQIEATQPIRALGVFEELNVLLPFVLLLAISVELAMNYSPTMDQRHNFNLAENLLFFDSMHVTFTFFMIWILPEAKSFVAQSWRQRSGWVFVALNLVLVFPLARFALNHKILSESAAWLVLLPINLLFFGHSGKQVFGISMLYNRKASKWLSIEQRDRVRTLERRERWALRALIALVILYRSHSSTTALISAQLLPAVSVMILLVTCYILFTVFGYRGRLWSFKKMYICRILLLPLAAFSNFAMLAFAGLHGVEYLFFTLHLVQASALRKKALSIATLLGVGLLYCVASYPGLFLGSGGIRWRPDPPTLEMIGMFTFTVAHLHFYLDGILFKMKNPLVCATLGPILLAGAASEGEAQNQEGIFPLSEPSRLQNQAA